MRAHRAAALDSLIHANGEFHPKFFRHRLGFEHHGADDGAGAIIAHHVFQRGQGEGRDRVEGEIAPELDPYLIANPRPHRRLEPRRDEAFGQFGHPVRARAIRLAQGKAVTLEQFDNPRFGHFGSGVDHAANGALRAPDLPLHVIRVDAAHPHIAVSAIKAVEIPPGHAIDRHHHGGVRADQRRHGRHGRGHGMRLEAHHDIILHAQFSGIGRDPGVGDALLAMFAQNQPALLHGHKMRPARHKRDIGAGRRQFRAQKPANGPRAKDRNFHALFPSFGSGRAKRLIRPTPISPPGQCAAACQWPLSGCPPGTPHGAAP